MFMLLISLKTYTNLIFFLLLIGINGAWVYSRFRKNTDISLAPYIFLNLCLLIFWARTVAIECDESEHLHCAWLVSRGLIPFKDFWQHHSPLIWVFMSPFIKICKSSVSVFELSRAAAFAVSLANFFVGWLIARKCWEGKAGISVYLLIISSAAIFGQFCWLRPDLFMQFFLLAGIYCCLNIPGKKLSPALWTGIAFGLAESFIFKQYLILLAPLIIILRENHRLKPAKVFLYLSGIVLGCCPLIYYLVSRNIVYEFFFWVVRFNGKRLIFSNAFPLAISGLGVCGAYLLFKRCRSSGDIKPFIVLTFFCLSFLSSLTGLSPVPISGAGYYLSFWFIMCGIAGSGCRFLDVIHYFKSFRSRIFVFSVVPVLFVFPNIMLNMPRKGEAGFSENKKVIARLMDYCGDESCFAIVPFHPIFNFDATRLFLIWQRSFAMSLSSVKNDLLIRSIAADILNKRPAVIVYRIDGRLTVVDWLLNGWVSKEDYNKLLRFFEREYTVVKIGKEKFYIRNDKLGITASSQDTEDAADGKEE
ncbi:MAG: hypothetical protein PHC33_01350 [Candidatus Omnitrophica bacterium]|nr:hypothetical protein [Candidatus Omnitrophota bacterium]